MKKILFLILIGIISTTGAFAQYDPDFEFNLQDYKSDPDPITGDVTFNFEAAMLDINEQELEVTVLVPAILDEEIIDDIDFQAMLEDPDNPVEITAENPDGDFLSPGALADIREELLLADPTLADDLDLLDSTMEVVNALVNDGDTIGDVKENPDIDFSAVEDLLVTAVAETVKGSIIDDEMEAELEDSLVMAAAGLKLLNGFAQSTANSAVANSMFGYQDYKLFTFSFGTLGSFSMPTPMDTVNDVMDITALDLDTNEMIDELDALGIEAGVTLQGITFSLGLNLSWLIDDLYASIILGSTEAVVSSSGESTVNILGSVQSVPAELPDDIPELTLEMGSSIYGVKVNYQLVNGFGIPILFRWNGLSVGTGFI